jgi:hypothetical protein
MDKNINKAPVVVVRYSAKIFLVMVLRYVLNLIIF